MARTWPVAPNVFRDLLGTFPTMMVGATHAEPGYFPPEGFGIGRRQEPERNKFLGSVFTWPEPNTFVIGANYYDRNDHGDNEDMYKLSTSTPS